MVPSGRMRSWSCCSRKRNQKASKRTGIAKNHQFFEVRMRSCDGDRRRIANSGARAIGKMMPQNGHECRIQAERGLESASARGSESRLQPIRVRLIFHQTAEPLREVLTIGASFVKDMVGEVVFEDLRWTFSDQDGGEEEATQSQRLG